MATRAKKSDFGQWVRQNALSLITLATGIVGFIFLQLNTIGEIKYTVNNQKEQFVSMQHSFEQFDKTQKSNYESYAANAKVEAEKTSKALEVLSLNSVRTGTQVEGVTKQLDEVKSELKSLSSGQRENRQILQQGKQ